MSYKHFGRIGDIWKHIPLCEFLAIEQPNRYIETNSAYPEYQLTNSFEQQYGILHLEKNIQKYSLIQKSYYWKILSELPENKNSISKYLGSPALALNILQETTNNFVFFDIEQACLEKIVDYGEKLNIASKIICKNEDSIAGLKNLLEELTPDDFIHVDPYLIHEKNQNGDTYFNVFVKAMKQAVMGMLWYGFNTTKERNDLHHNFQLEKGANQTTLQGIEITSILLSDKRLDVNPGILGCGILIGNLSETSYHFFKEAALEVINIYQDSTMFDKYSGKLKLEEFEIRI